MINNQETHLSFFDVTPSFSSELIAIEVEDIVLNLKDVTKLKKNNLQRIQFFL